MGDVSGSRETLFVDVGKDYADGTTIDARFSVGGNRAGVTVLFGPSGAGKTTLLRLIAGLEHPSRGTIRYGSEVWSAAGWSRNLSPQRRGVGYLVQDYALFPHMSVRRNIAHGLHGLPRSERDLRIDRLAERLDLGPLLARRPGELSGGEQQRVALARALVRRPRFVMLDEPFAALDGPLREEVRAWVARVFADLGVPSIVVTHDWVDALNLGDTMIVLDKGKVLQQGTPPDVLTRPRDAEVARIAGVDTIVRCRVDSRSDGAVRLRAGDASVTAVDPGGAGDAYWLCVRGEDVTVERGTGGPTSARNRLDGTVVATSPRGPLVKVVLEVGFPLTALVTRQAAQDLDLRNGERVSAVFKASVVHLVPREGTGP